MRALFFILASMRQRLSFMRRMGLSCQRELYVCIVNNLGIRIIYDRYIHTNSGINGVASYLNDNGYTKKLRQNNTIPGFSSGFVKSVLDNPVYMGKIAYGRRRTEKKIGTRNEMHIVEQDEYPIYDGHHEAIISEEDWQLAQEKRKANNFKREKVHDIEHAHILSGLLKCPCCGKSLYGNIAKAHSKDKYTRYYYYCKNTLGATGHKCSFRLNIEQTEMNRMVAAIISALVKDKRFKDAIKAKIGTAVDTSEMEKRIEALRTQLKQVQGTKTRLEHQMDNLDVLDTHYNKKISDLQRRYDEQYDKAETIETQMDEWNSRLLNVRQEKISADNVYQLLLEIRISKFSFRVNGNETVFNREEHLEKNYWRKERILDIEKPSHWESEEKKFER